MSDREPPIITPSRFFRLTSLDGGCLTLLRYHLQLDHEGALCASTAGGLSRLKDGRIATLTSKNGFQRQREGHRHKGTGCGRGCRPPRAARYAVTSQTRRR